MKKYYLEKVINNESLTLYESYDLMDQVMNGVVNNALLAGLLVALKAKGEAAEEIAGFARAMRDKSIKLIIENNDAIDVCGTGGDNSGSFNISTAAAFVVAGAGVKVAKHGNRSISSKCGSADVLQQLGVNIELSLDRTTEQLEKFGITFLFAPNYHPAMKYASTVRKELGFKTVFNLLGPLTNPTGVKKQLIGVYSAKAAKLMSEAAVHLDMEKVSFICTANQYDEITLSDSTSVFEFEKESGNKRYTVTPDTFGYSQISFDKIEGGDVKYNADIIYRLLKDKVKKEHFYVVTANAALALHTAGFDAELINCILAAEESILSGNAYKKLLDLQKNSN